MATEHPTQRTLFDADQAPKRCTQCGATKPVQQFSPLKTGRDGRMAECRACNRARSREWHAANRERNRSTPPPPEGTKRCAGCKEVKPLAEFSRWPGSKDGFLYCCKPCRAAEKKAEHKRRQADPDAKAAHRRRRRRTRNKTLYGLTEGQYEIMLAAQSGVCAVCGRPEVQGARGGGVKPLAVDHDHDTGRLRALLCSHCNQGIGHFFDDPVLLRLAAAYLERHGQETLKV